jgi:hypothetical protein
MSRKKKTFERSIEIVKQIIMAHQRLFVEVYLIDSPEMQGILH